MAKVRFEVLVSRVTMGGLASSLGMAALEKIGPGNTEVTPSGSSQVGYGPAPEEVDVYVRNFGGQVYVTKGVAPVASLASGTLLSDKEYVPIHLLKGESIAVITATVA